MDQADVGRKVIGIERKRIHQPGLRLGRIAAAEQHDRTGHRKIAALRRQRDGGIDGGQSLVLAAEALQRKRFPIVVFSRIRRFGKLRFGQAQCFGGLAAAQGGENEIGHKNP